MNSLTVALLLSVPGPSPANDDSTSTSRLKICRRSRASVVLPDDEGPERPMSRVVCRGWGVDVDGGDEDGGDEECDIAVRRVVEGGKEGG